MNEDLYPDVALMVNAIRRADQDVHEMKKFVWALATLKGENANSVAFPEIEWLIASKITGTWHSDPLVRAYKGLIKSCTALIEPSREEIARGLVVRAKEYNCVDKDRVALCKLAAEILGFVKSNGKNNPEPK